MSDKPIEVNAVDEPKPRNPHKPKPWRTKFLEAYEASGRKYESAKLAKVSIKRLEHEIDRDPRFARLVETARQRYADSIEAKLEAMAAGQRGNVVAAIVLAKRHRPQEFIERHVMVQANVTALASPSDAQELLRRMLASNPAETRKALLPANTSLPTADASGARTQKESFTYVDELGVKRTVAQDIQS